MKCIGCGGEIGLTDEFCPHCGRKITETAGYRADMKAYKGRSEKAKRGLAKAMEGNMPMVISAVLMVVLLIGFLGAYYVKVNAYSFRGDAKRRESKKNYEAYSAEIEKYLEAGDYTGFISFMGVHNIAEWEEPYKDLRLLSEVAGEYASIVSCMEEVAMFGPNPRWYNPESDVASCQRAIWWFYYDYENDLEKIENDKYVAYIQDVRREADAVLKIYLGLDDEGLERFLASSDIEQEAYLAEVFIHEE